MPEPVWADGTPANPEAASEDALEWLRFARDQRLLDFPKWTGGNPETLGERLEATIGALGRELTVAAIQGNS